MSVTNYLTSAGSDEMLAIARNLARIYTDVLEQPLPSELADLIARLEERSGPR